MKIIIGLGNIGDKYAKNRHNVGFMVLDELIKGFEKEKLPIEIKDQSKFKAIIAKTKYKDVEMLLVKPTTLMNNSGEAVSKILSFYKQPLEDLIIIYDDIDLPLGKTRFREKGSAGTHNGMRSIIEHLGSENFKRIRIGIESRGNLSPKQQDLSSYVLSDFTKEELIMLKTAIQEAKTFILNLLD